MKNWRMIRTCLVAIIGTGFILLENVVGQRLVILLSLFAILTVMPFVRYVFREKLRVVTFAIDVASVILLGYFSRYVVNYYVYILLMLLIFEIGIMYMGRLGYLMISLIMVLTLYNYGVLLYYRRNYGTLSEVAFMIVINVLIIVCIQLMHRYRKEKNKQEVLNVQLEKLTSVAVKNKIARDIHDTFGHDMMALIMELEMAQALIDKDPMASKEMVNRAKNSARQGMKTIRKVVETLRNEEEFIDESIEVMILRFKERVGVEVNYDLAEAIDRYPDAKEVLYHLIQEAMTNSIRHGNATAIEIYVKEGLKTLSFMVKDNGIGAEMVSEGYGLKGMGERVASLNGRLEIRQDNGFIIEGYVEVDND